MLQPISPRAPGLPKMATLLAIILTGCFSGGDATTPTTFAPSPGSSDRHAFVKQVVTALSNKDVAALEQLAKNADVMTRIAQCTTHKAAASLQRELERTRRMMKSRMVELDSATLQLVAITGQDEDTYHIKQGQTLGKGCVARADVDIHELTIKIRITDRGEGTYDHELQLVIGEVLPDHAMFLESIKPIELRKSRGPSEQSVTRVTAFADTMCACRDKTCADRVLQEYAAALNQDAQHLPNGGQEDTSDPEVLRASTRLMECFDKASP